MKTAIQIKEDDIRPADLFAEFMRLSTNDALHFFDKNKFVQVSCPGCGSDTPSNDGFTKHSFHYDHCGACGTLYVNPRPDPAELLRYYAQSDSQRFWVEDVLKTTGEKRKEQIMLPNIERIEQIIQEFSLTPNTVLDVGCSNGIFLKEWKKRYPDTDLLGIEPGEEAAQKSRAAGITIFEGFVEEEAEKDEACGDLVTCFEVLEHVQDPLKFAQSLSKVTKPGGTAVITCLGADGFDIQLLWDQAKAIMPPYHLNFLSVDGMRTMFSKAGFDEVEVRTPGRLDVEIVEKFLDKGGDAPLSRFETLLLSKSQNDPDFKASLQTFLAKEGLSSHVWIICRKNA